MHSATLQDTQKLMPFTDPSLPSQHHPAQRPEELSDAGSSTTITW